MTKPLRFLLATFDGGGNLSPELALGQALTVRGHDVRILGNSSIQRVVEAAGCRFRLYEHAPTIDWTSARSPEDELRYVFSHILFNARYGHDLLAELVHEPADILLVDRMLYGAIAAAESTGLPTAILWHTLFGVMQQGPWAERFVRGRDTLNALRRDFGLAPVSTSLEQTNQVQLVLAFVPAFFDVGLPEIPENVHYVGPLRPSTAAVSHEPIISIAQDTRPLVVVSFSTVYQRQMAPLQRVLDATAELPIRVLLTVGHGVDPASLTPPPHAVVERFIPHAEVLPQAALLVTHAGLGTVMAGLIHGVPLLCLPMGRDQYDNAQRVEILGFGRTLTVEASVTTLHDTISNMLEESSYRCKAKALGQTIDIQRGMSNAVSLVEGLLPSRSG